MRRMIITALRRALTVMWAVMVVSLIALAAWSHLAPLIVVAGSSMQPALPAGAVILPDAVDADEVVAGDVLTVRADNGVILTHRVTRVLDLPEGRFFELKGDANATPDPGLVPARAIVGRVDRHVPVVGYVLGLISMPSGLVFMLAGLATLLVGIWLLEEIELATTKTARHRAAPAAAHLPGRGALGLVLALILTGSLSGGGARPSLALLTDSENDPSTFTTAASFPDTTPPTVASSVISKTTPYLPGFIRQGGTYFVYADVTDAGSGVATVTANVSTVTTGQTLVALVPGAYSIGGVTYNYRSASVTANAVLAAGAKTYTITATDAAANSVTQGGFSVTVDNTRPTGTNVQTTNAGITGQPGLGDTMTLTFSEQIDPQSVLAGWTGLSTNVVVRITQAAGGDQVTVRNAANTAALPLGTVNLVGTNYVTVTRDFGATGTASTMVQAGNAITVTLGSPSGAAATQATANNMIWTPSATAADRAGNACQTTNATEVAPLDIDF
jgi:signal peptidase I